MTPLMSCAEIERLDATRMPFGQFVGRRMAGVPAWYLDALRDCDDWSPTEYPQVAEYLEKMARYIDLELQ